MGLFKKVKEGLDNSAAAAQWGGQVNAQQQQYAAMQQQGAIGVQGGPGIDPAAFGGPSTKPLDPNDPLLQPVNGVSLEQYATYLKAASGAGYTDEASIYQYIEATYQLPAGTMAPVAAEWTNRMKQSMVVGQQFNKIYMGR